MHRLLRRQLRKYLGIEDEVPEPLSRFIAAVDAAYADFDSDRAMLERSLELSSKELSDAHDEAKRARERLIDAIESTSEGFASMMRTIVWSSATRAIESSSTPAAR